MILILFNFHFISTLLPHLLSLCFCLLSWFVDFDCLVDFTWFDIALFHFTYRILYFYLTLSFLLRVCMCFLIYFGWLNLFFTSTFTIVMHSFISHSLINCTRRFLFKWWLLIQHSSQLFFPSPSFFRICLSLSALSLLFSSFSYQFVFFSPLSSQFTIFTACSWWYRDL